MDRASSLKSFASVNRQRLDQLQQLAPASQQVFYALLAFLFHGNHKLLPGYISDDVPQGIMDYQPDKTALNAALSLNKSFNYRHKSQRRYALRGVYLLNPQGCLSYPLPCQLELWLVHSGRLQSQQRALLQQKLAAIVSWADSLGIELRAELFSDSDWADSSLTVDLDGFYSYGMVVAGSVPLWWLTSAEEDAAAHTPDVNVNPRLISDCSVIDFGRARPATAQQLFVTASQAFEHCLHQGLRELPALLFYRQQLLNYPEPALLSRTVKNVLPDSAQHALYSDPQILYYQHLQATGAELLTLCQRGLYQRAREPLSKTVHSATYPWRRQFMQQQLARWQWSDAQLRAEDHTLAAQHHSCQQDWQLCQPQLADCLQQLQQFAIRQQLPVTAELRSMQAMLDYWSRPAADSLAVMPPRQQARQAESRLTVFRAAKSTANWQLFADAAMSTPPLFQAESIVQLLALAIVNRSLDRSSWLQLHDQQQRFNSDQLQQLTQQLLRSPLSLGSVWPQVPQLQSPASLSQLWLWINIEQQAPDALREQGMKVSSRQNDPLSYSSRQLNWVVDSELLMQSERGDWIYQRHNGADSAARMLETLLRWAPEQLKPEHIHCYCQTPIYGTAISQRLLQLCQDVLRHYQRYPERGRYLLRLADQHYQLYWHQQQTELERLPAGLKQPDWLCLSQPAFTGTAVDRQLDSSGLLQALLSRQTPGQLSVFLLFADNRLQFHVLDEHGCLFSETHTDLQESTLLHQLRSFLGQIKQHNQLAHLHFYRLQNTMQGWQISSLALPQLERDYLPVQVVLDSEQADALCHIHCGSTQFSGKANDAALFADLKQWLLSQRGSLNRYRLYLTRLQFSDAKSRSACRYLLKKQQLEQLMNRKASP